MEVFEAIRNRRSIRRYKSTPVPREHIIRCLEAARWAPSARNSQPWEFIVVTKEDVRRKLAEVHMWGRHIAEAPVTVIFLADPEKSPRYWMNDLGACIMNFMLEAFDLGLGTCWIGVCGSPFEEEFKKILGVPERLRVVAAVTLGYPDESPSKSRRSLEELTSWECYGCK